MATSTFRPAKHLLHLGLLALAACGRDNGAPTAAIEPDPIPVRAAIAVLSEDNVPIVAPGVLSRKTEANLAFKTGGIVALVNVRSGDTVRRGQVLATLRLDELDSAVAQAQSAADKAARDVARFTDLHAKQAVSEENVQNARTLLEQANAALRAAQFNREVAILTAPSDGRILARDTEPGEMAGPGQPIVRFATEDDGWLVKCGLPERDIAALHIGDRAEATFQSIADSQPLAAEVAHISEQADPRTRTTQVELRLLDLPPGIPLRSGLVGHCTLFLGKHAPRLAVPLAALVEGQGRSAHLFTIKPDNRVTRHTVEVEQIYRETAFLQDSGGVRPGDKVIVTGAEYLRENAKVIEESGTIAGN